MMDSRLRGKNGRSGNDVVAYGEWGRATTRVAPTGERHDVGGRRAVPEPPLWGRLVERLNVTGDD